eukprot:CAMPEP_0172211798 /NCGR_PEP_ID=MMETSP1050-20130122/36615_1 /TAXON_ID=233186 /ORGANISM="Cryptomonas curvata, Strain CCAP979/52" /LENGTH=122 /DNA_ID=CAMNT_0012892315 /DNA_START=269 /DNA_END=634 /DNA_ORIENTATION=-
MSDAEPKRVEAESCVLYRSPRRRKAIMFDPTYCVAPMVGQSDLSFRLLCLRHGATVCWTEMLYSDKIVSDHEYCRAALKSSRRTAEITMGWTASTSTSVALRSEHRKGTTGPSSLTSETGPW